MSHVFKLSQPCINNRFNDAVAPHGCRINVVGVGRIWGHDPLRVRWVQGSGGQRRVVLGLVWVHFSQSHSYSEGWFNEKVTHSTGDWNAALVVVLHPFDQPTWDMEMLKILIILDIRLLTGVDSFKCGIVNILVAGHFIIACNLHLFTEISIPCRHNFKSNFSLISCSMFIFSWWRL